MWVLAFCRQSLVTHTHTHTHLSLSLQALAREYREVDLILNPSLLHPLHSFLVLSDLSLHIIQLDILFMEDFGKTPDQLFKSFSPEPVAAASLAQVFKATTHDNKEVAVKVGVALRA